ncbi:MAG: hypothetical protein KF750_00565 [Xanthobacteraceae bacterium]|nr:hypothetical protein [Xanthobacteraceae bacterium]
MTEQKKVIPLTAKNHFVTNYPTARETRNGRSPQARIFDLLLWRKTIETLQQQQNSLRQLDRHRAWYSEYGWRCG